MEQDFQEIDLKFAIDEIKKVPRREKEISAVFVEMLKDEINSTEEAEVYNGVKKLIIKYLDNDKVLKLIDEVIENISGGASLTEVLLVAKDEVISPTPLNVMDFDNIAGHEYNISESKRQKH